MAHEITCTTHSSPPAPSHAHILSVGLASGQQQSVETVRFRITQGETYYTVGAGRTATVRAYDCYCGFKTIRSGPDAILANNLDNLPTC